VPPGGLDDRAGVCRRGSSGGGYTARAVGASIVTEADDLEGLRNQVRDAVRCHFDEGAPPKLIRLHPRAMK
jgi:hypothetical protein